MGGRYTSDKVREPLKEAIEKHIIEYGANAFYVGYRGNFDRMCIGVLRELREKNHSIILYIVEPYALTKPKIEAPQGFTLFYPEIEHVPLPYAIVSSNRYMVQYCEYLIICPSAVGNSRKIVEFAQRREKQGLIKITLL